MNILDEINILCPSCQKPQKANTESFNKFEIQKCEHCSHDFTLFDVIDAYEKWESYIDKGFDIHSNLTIKDIEIECDESYKDSASDINTKINLLKLTKELVYNTIKYGTSYVRTIVDNGKFNGFEVLDPKITRIKSKWGTLPPRVISELIPLEYYEIDCQKRNFSPKEVHHFSTSLIGIDKDNLYGLPIIYPLLRIITYYKHTGHEHFKNEIKYGFDVPSFLIEKQELHNIAWAIHDIDLFKYSIETMVNNIIRYLESIFQIYYGEETKIRIWAKYYTSDEILKKTGYELEITKYRAEINKIKIDTYKPLLEIGIITEDEFKELTSK